MQDKYYYTPSAFYTDSRVNNSEVTLTADAILSNWPHIVPQGATIVGHIHSHPWPGGPFAKWSFGFSNGNKIGEEKFADNDVVDVAVHPKYIYYLYNSLGMIGVKRPGEQDSSGDPELTQLAYDLPWDPEAIPMHSDEKLGPYPSPGPWRIDFDNFEGDRSKIYPIP